MFIKGYNLIFSLVVVAQANKLNSRKTSFNKLADYLHARDIKGTFFVNGNNWACIYDEQIVAKLKHTWSHPDITTLTDDQFRQQLDLIEIALKRSINESNLRILRERGYKVINWSFDSRDADGVSPSESKSSYDQLAKQYPSPQIALNHETHESTVTDVTPHAISVLQKAGYKLVNVAECLGLQSTSEEFYQSVGQPEERDVRVPDFRFDSTCQKVRTNSVDFCGKTWTRFSTSTASLRYTQPVEFIQTSHPVMFKADGTKTDEIMS
ncbi:hypothetical protein DFH28DRAFT_923625 [Melampsora americana]|nr:hypothetical protein DFH28DRAFT_923625 [Melampsora americana]